MLEKLPRAIGHALSRQRAGLEKIVFNRIDLRSGVGGLTISSPAFADHAPIPSRYTADGEAISPPMQWSGVPDATACLALIVEDADSPTPEPLVHAIAVDLDPHISQLLEGQLHTDDTTRSGVHLGRNSYLKQAWLPPDPPPGHGTHRYAFQLFALRAGARFADAPGREELAKAIGERALCSGCLIGTYERDSTAKLNDRWRVDESALAVAPTLRAVV